jgi:hypothetical protein
LQHFGSRPDDKVNEPRFFVPNNKKVYIDYLELMMNTPPLLFMGEMAKAISI